MLKHFFCTLALLTVLTGAGHASYLYELSVDGGTAVSITPYEGTWDDAAYYQYTVPNGASGAPRHGYTATDTAYFWLYKNTNTGSLGMSVIFNTVSGGSGGDAHFSINGLPSNWSWTVMDDPNENTNSAATDISASWRWLTGVTDGGTIGGLEDREWNITWQLAASQGITDWYFLSAGQAPMGFNPNNSSTHVAPITISSIYTNDNNPVPEPGTIILLGMGLLGLSGLSRKKF